MPAPWRIDNYNEQQMTDSLSRFKFPAQYVEVFESLVTERGIPASLFYERCQLNRQQLEAPGAAIDGEHLRQMLRVCGELADPDRPLSAQLLEHFPLTAHGTLGVVVLTSPNLQAALNAALRFYPVVVPAYEISREEMGDQLHLVFRPLCDFGEVSETLTETVLGAFNSIRRYVRPDIPLLAIHLSHEARFPLEAYSTFSEPDRIFFGQPCNKIVIPRKYLQLSLTTSNRATMQQFERQLERQIRELGQEPAFTRQVQSLVEQLLRAGKSLNVDEVAAQLNLSTRTLSRRLHEEGNTFKELVTEARIDYAEFLLLNSQKSVSQIGYATGFTNDSSFSRAFRKTKGISPTELRRRIQKS